MSQKSRVIFSVAAAALTLGAVPLALGRDLSGGLQDRLQSAFNDTLDNPSSDPLGAPATAINRAAKADRPAGVVRSDAPSRTILLHLNGVTNTSVLVRLPVAQASRGGGAAAPLWLRSGDGKRAVACEPAVSVLTEIAKRLQPGRCLT